MSTNKDYFIKHRKNLNNPFILTKDLIEYTQQDCELIVEKNLGSLEMNKFRLRFKEALPWRGIVVNKPSPQDFHVLSNKITNLLDHYNQLINDQNNNEKQQQKQLTQENSKLKSEITQNKFQQKVLLNENANLTKNASQQQNLSEENNKLKQEIDTLRKNKKRLTVGSFIGVVGLVIAALAGGHQLGSSLSTIKMHDENKALTDSIKNLKIQHKKELDNKEKEALEIISEISKENVSLKDSLKKSTHN